MSLRRKLQRERGPATLERALCACGRGFMRPIAPKESYYYPYKKWSASMNCPRCRAGTLSKAERAAISDLHALNAVRQRLEVRLRLITAVNSYAEDEALGHTKAAMRWLSQAIPQHLRAQFAEGCAV